MIRRSTPTEKIENRESYSKVIVKPVTRPRANTTFNEKHVFRQKKKLLMRSIRKHQKDDLAPTKTKMKDHWGRTLLNLDIRSHKKWLGLLKGPKPRDRRKLMSDIRNKDNRASLRKLKKSKELISLHADIEKFSKDNLKPVQKGQKDVDKSLGRSKLMMQIVSSKKNRISLISVSQKCFQDLLHDIRVNESHKLKKSPSVCKTKSFQALLQEIRGFKQEKLRNSHKLLEEIRTFDGTKLNPTLKNVKVKSNFNRAGLLFEVKWNSVQTYIGVRYLKSTKTRVIRNLLSDIRNHQLVKRTLRTTKYSTKNIQAILHDVRGFDKKKKLRKHSKLMIDLKEFDKTAGLKTPEGIKEFGGIYANRSFMHFELQSVPIQFYWGDRKLNSCHTRSNQALMRDIRSKPKLRISKTKNVRAVLQDIRGFDKKKNLGKAPCLMKSIRSFDKEKLKKTETIERTNFDRLMLMDGIQKYAVQVYHGIVELNSCKTKNFQESIFCHVLSLFSDSFVCNVIITFKFDTYKC